MWRSAFVIGALGVIAAWVSAGSSVGGPAQPGGEAAPQPEVGEQAEAFRRLMYIKLRDALEPAESRGRATNFWQSAVGQVAATYLPGYGLCVSAEVRMPARPRANGGRAELWDQLSKDVAAGRSAGEGYFAQVTPYCSDCSGGAAVSLTAAADAIVRTVAENGYRLTSLESEDRVTIALRLTPRADTLSHLAHSMESMRGSRGSGQRQRFGGESSREPTTGAASPVPAEPADSSAVPNELRRLSAAVKEGAGPTNILMTFRVRDLLQYQQKQLSVSEFAKAAIVTAY